MKEYARGFYKSKEWHKVSRLYMSSKHYVCERCGSVGVICHHKKYITPANIHNAEITLNFENLECLCMDCHNKEHSMKRSQARFDKSGNLTDVKESAEIEEYKTAAQAIEKMKERFDVVFESPLFAGEVRGTADREGLLSKPLR